MIHKMWYLQILQVTWVQWSQRNESVTGVDLWKQKAKRKPRKTKKKQPFHIVSSPVSRGDKLWCQEPGQVNAKKSVVQYKQFNCVINNQ